MNLTKLFEMQRTLDERIVKEKGMEGQDLLPNTVLALQIELAEMINEWRGFKHWSSDQEPRRGKMITEAADCLHFFLSIARQMGLTSGSLYVYDIYLEDETSLLLTKLIVRVGEISTHRFTEGRYASFEQSWYLFINILEQRLQIHEDDLYQAYLDKNEVNHKRQDTGY